MVRGKKQRQRRTVRPKKKPQLPIKEKQLNPLYTTVTNHLLHISTSSNFLYAKKCSLKVLEIWKPLQIWHYVKKKIHETQFKM